MVRGCLALTLRLECPCLFFLAERCVFGNLERRLISALAFISIDIYQHWYCLLGFSRKMVALLRELDAEFSTFNILADDEVRFIMLTITETIV
jgi:hypothetical protein